MKDRQFSGRHGSNPDLLPTGFSSVVTEVVDEVVAVANEGD